MRLDEIVKLPAQQLVPQRHPILMVDGVAKVDGDVVTSHFTINQENLFVEDGLLLEAGLMENMAQTAALRSGVVALLQAPDGVPVSPPIGFIGAVKDFALIRRPQHGQTLSTTVSVANDMGQFLVVRAQASDSAGLCAQCEMTLFIQPAEGGA